MTLSTFLSSSLCADGELGRTSGVQTRTHGWTRLLSTGGSSSGRASLSSSTPPPFGTDPARSALTTRSMEIFRVDKYVTLGEVEVGGGAAGRPFHLELAGRPPVRTTLPLATFAPSSPHSLTHTKLTGSGMSAFGAKTSDLCPQAGGFERSGRMERTVSTRSSSHGPGSPLRRTRCPTLPDSERHSKEGRQGR